MAPWRGLNVRLSAIPGVTKRGVLPTELYLPVVIGQEFRYAKSGGHNNYDSVSAGEFSQAIAGEKAPKLLTIDQLDTVAMIWEPRWVTNPGQGYERVPDELEKTLDSRQPFQLLIWNAGERPDINCWATLRSFEPQVRHGEPDARYFTLSFSQYRRPIVKRLGKGKGSGGGGGASRKKGKRRPGLPTKHVLKATDTLRSLSERYYGTGSGWRVIADKNGVNRWGSEDPLVDMSRFRVGSKVIIPEFFTASFGLEVL
jgi:hypothetical protein